MARIASNAPLTNQGRADLRRVPTGTQTDFNQTGDSSISVVEAELLTLVDGNWVTPEFTPLVVKDGDDVARAVCVFLWMTDRLTSVSAKQSYAGPVYPASTSSATLPVGTDLCTCAEAFPCNGMSGLPVGAACTLLATDEIGAQAVLSFGTGANALNVRGTPVLVLCVNNEFYGPGAAVQAVAQASLRLSALSESILSGKPSAAFLTPSTGAFDPYADIATARAQCVMNAANYIAGQYWLNGNQFVDDVTVYDIVGVYTAPVPPVVP